MPSNIESESESVVGEEKRHNPRTGWIYALRKYDLEEELRKFGLQPTGKDSANRQLLSSFIRGEYRPPPAIINTQICPPGSFNSDLEPEARESETTKATICDGRPNSNQLSSAPSGIEAIDNEITDVGPAQADQAISQNEVQSTGQTFLSSSSSASTSSSLTSDSDTSSKPLTTTSSAVDNHHHDSGSSGEEYYIHHFETDLDNTAHLYSEPLIDSPLAPSNDHGDDDNHKTTSYSGVTEAHVSSGMSQGPSYSKLNKLDFEETVTLEADASSTLPNKPVQNQQPVAGVNKVHTSSSSSHFSSSSGSSPGPKPLDAYNNEGDDSGNYRKTTSQSKVTASHQSSGSSLSSNSELVSSQTLQNGGSSGDSSSDKSIYDHKATSTSTAQHSSGSGHQSTSSSSSSTSSHSVPAPKLSATSSQAANKGQGSYGMSQESSQMIQNGAAIAATAATVAVAGSTSPRKPVKTQNEKTVARPSATSLSHVGNNHDENSSSDESSNDHKTMSTSTAHHSSGSAHHSSTSSSSSSSHSVPALKPLTTSSSTANKGQSSYGMSQESSHTLQNGAAVATTAATVAIAGSTSPKKPVQTQNQHATSGANTVNTSSGSFHSSDSNSDSYSKPSITSPSHASNNHGDDSSSDESSHDLKATSTSTAQHSSGSGHQSTSSSSSSSTSSHSLPAPKLSETSSQAANKGQGSYGMSQESSQMIQNGAAIAATAATVAIAGSTSPKKPVQTQNQHVISGATTVHTSSGSSHSSHSNSDSYSQPSTTSPSHTINNHGDDSSSDENSHDHKATSTSAAEHSSGSGHQSTSSSSSSSTSSHSLTAPKLSETSSQAANKGQGSYGMSQESSQMIHNGAAIAATAATVAIAGSTSPKKPVQTQNQHVISGATTVHTSSGSSHSSHSNSDSYSQPSTTSPSHTINNHGDDSSSDENSDDHKATSTSAAQHSSGSGHQTTSSSSFSSSTSSHSLPAPNLSATSSQAANKGQDSYGMSQESSQMIQNGAAIAATAATVAIAGSTSPKKPVQTQNQHATSGATTVNTSSGSFHSSDSNSDSYFKPSETSLSHASNNHGDDSSSDESSHDHKATSTSTAHHFSGSSSSSTSSHSLPAPKLSETSSQAANKGQGSYGMSQESSEMIQNGAAIAATAATVAIAGSTSPKKPVQTQNQHVISGATTVHTSSGSSHSSHSNSDSYSQPSTTSPSHTINNHGDDSSSDENSDDHKATSTSAAEHSSGSGHQSTSSSSFSSSTSSHSLPAPKLSATSSQAANKGQDSYGMSQESSQMIQNGAAIAATAATVAIAGSTSPKKPVQTQNQHATSGVTTVNTSSGSFHSSDSNSDSYSKPSETSPSHASNNHGDDSSSDESSHDHKATSTSTAHHFSGSGHQSTSSSSSSSSSSSTSSSSYTMSQGSSNLGLSGTAIAATVAIAGSQQSQNHQGIYEATKNSGTTQQPGKGKENCNWCLRSECNPGACRAIPNFDAKKDAKDLYDAMKVLGTKESVLTDIIIHRSEEQLELIRQAYQEYGRHFDKDVLEDHSLRTKDLFKALLQRREDFFASELKRAFKKRDENAMIMILTSVSPCAVREIGSAYHRKYNKPLIEAAKEASNMKFEAFLVELIKGNRDKDGPVNAELAKKDAESLKKAGIDAWFKEKSVFINIFTHRSYSHIRMVREEYDKLQSESSLDKDIEKHSGGGDLTKGLRVMLQNIENQPRYFADEIEGAARPLVGTGIRDHKVLIRILRGRCGIDLGDISKVYPTTHTNKPLEQLIKERSYGDYENALVQMVKTN